MRSFLRAVLVLAACAAPPGCSCSRLHGEVDDLAFTRCAQLDAPRERKMRTAKLDLEIKGRLIEVKPRAALRIVAFTGPVGAPFSRTDLAALAASAPSLMLMLGGLGNDVSVATANLTALAALQVPLLFIAGGADRAAVLGEAFGNAEGAAGEWLVHASAARELRIGLDRFAIVPGAPLGRYALDEDACGFTTEDLGDIHDALDDDAPKGGRVWLLGWAAPSGWQITAGAGGSDVGSAELADLAGLLKARGGLFAYPESQAFAPVLDKTRGGLALVVPRLARTGTLRANGGIVPRALAVLTLDREGLRVAP